MIVCLGVIGPHGCPKLVFQPSSSAPITTISEKDGFCPSPLPPVAVYDQTAGLRVTWRAGAGTGEALVGNQARDLLAEAVASVAVRHQDQDPSSRGGPDGPRAVAYTDGSAYNLKSDVLAYGG